MQKPAVDPLSIVSDQTPRQLFGRLWSGYLRKHAWWIALAFVLMVVEGSTLGLLSYMLQPMFDVVFVEGQSNMIWLVASAIFALFVVRAISGVIQRVLMTRTSYLASTELQIDLLGHTLELDNGFHSRTSPGALIERVQGDVISIQSLWNIIITGAGRDLISLVSLMAVAIMVDWRWTAVAIVGAPLLMLPSIVVQRYIRRKSHFLREIAGKRTTRLDEIFHGITPIKLNRMEGYQTGRFSELSNVWVQSTVKTTAGQAAVPGLVDLAVGFGFFCVLLYGGPEIISGEKTVGQFMSFFAAMALAFQPLRRLANVAGYWQVMQASLARIFGLLDTKPEVLETDTPAAGLPKDSSVRFDGVSLSYGDLPVLNELSFAVPRGTTTALVGQSGAGKSTVFNVLTRLIDAQNGTVKIGDTATTDLKLADLRSLFSVVSQDALLFDETLRDNILLGRTDVSDEALQEALDAAHVTDFLDTLPNGLETEVGPRGSNLSGGQRQRVAIARALLRDTPILLLDEATSALDAESEKVVQEALDRLSKGRTTLVIAHRLSTVRGADQIIVLDKGRLAEKGTHTQLLKKDGIYAHLHELQFQTGTQPFEQDHPSKSSQKHAGLRSLNDQELNADINTLPFGTFMPNALQAGLISLAHKTILKRGLFRGKLTSLILGLGKPALDIKFREAAFRIRGEGNLIEYNLLLNPAYNAEDIDFLIEGSKPDSNFVDLGSNIGLYSLPLAKVSPKGTVISIDANPLMADRLTWNAEASRTDNIQMVSVAISDQDGQGDLQIRKDDLAIVSVKESETGDIPVRRLDDVLTEKGITSIHGLKIDIEGHEDKALVPFLSGASDEMLPERIVIEHPAPDSDYPGCTAIFAKRGYQLVKRTKNNSLYLLQSSS